MQLSGVLHSWDDACGFGFITPTHGGADIFVHVSELPRGGTRPMVGETLCYELGRGRDGKPQAVKVVRLGGGTDRIPRTFDARNKKTKFSLPETLTLVAIIAIAGTWGYKHFSESQQRQALANESAVSISSSPVAAPTGVAPVEGATKPGAATYRCDGRTHCSQMTSCAEATWFINNCPGTKMDGNNDGIPCERQWCT